MQKNIEKNLNISYNTRESEEKRVVIKNSFLKRDKGGGTYQKELMNLLLNASRRKTPLSKERRK